ncbi:hypothetical protein M427DRAFT_114161 [Gonapodya prolifera JEL478]|uniref:Peptidase M48 domain-containing protein n=1 Tax=Gonapodya prolifera (strain JEL478) TaxID=1344416 RepID=A0A139A658_GONPJ|nr:hypothetical protein M427DRAFT_114161 [Gonapodya prolifera JEL478]|eukprot:KXS12286.1 hypothetical protein M427DRAFT_114161 [Gonapodya prolifera JEL478]
MLPLGILKNIPRSAGTLSGLLGRRHIPFRSFTSRKDPPIPSPGLNSSTPGTLISRPYRLSPEYSSHRGSLGLHKRFQATVAVPNPSKPSLEEARSVIREHNRERRSKRRRFATYVSASVLALSAGYYLMHLDTVPISGRIRFLDVTPQEEQWLAGVLYNELISDNQDNLLSEWNPLTLMVAGVAKRLIPVSGLTNLDWKVHVIENPEPNAFVLPGGKIFVNTGLFEIVRSVDELAIVLGHEIAHQVARHTSEKLSFNKMRILTAGLCWVFGIEWLVLQIAASHYFVSLPFSRQIEAEADYIGLHLAAAACYDPSAAPTLWTRFNSELGGLEKTAYLSDHPTSSARIEAVKFWLPGAIERRKASECDKMPAFMEAFMGMLGGWAGERKKEHVSTDNGADAKKPETASYEEFLQGLAVIRSTTARDIIEQHEGRTNK